MKTKFSRFGRSSVSVILAVMMLLSTMLIGTITTANAVDLTKFSKVYLDAKVAKYNDSTAMSSKTPKNAYAFNGNGSQDTYTNETSPMAGKDWPGGLLKSEGNNIYSILVSNDATNIIFNSGDKGKQTGDLQLPSNWKTTPMIYYGDGSTGSNGWTTYSTTKTLTTPVIEWANGDDGYIPPKGKQTLSVTNTSAYESISGVTYELYKGSSSSGTKTATGVTNATGVFDVTESAYYTVKVSTTDSDYTSPSSESNTLQSYSITPSYYLNGDITSGGWKDVHQDDNIVSDYYTGISSNKRIFSKTVEIDEGKYFRLIDSKNQQYKPDGSSNKNDFDVSNSTSYATKKLTTTKDGKNGAFKIPKAGKYIIYVDQSTTSPSVWVEEVTAPKHSVTYKSNNESMGSVTAVLEGTTTSIGTSPASVEEGKSVTFTATANNGYEFVGWYSDAACTGEAVNTNAEYTVSNISADTAVYAKFTEKEYTVSHTQGTGYTISSLPTAKVKYKDTVSFTVTPAEGYKINSVQYNGTDATKGDNNTYSFTMPAAEVIVTVTASAEAYNIINESTDVQATFTVDGKSVSEAKMGDKVTVSAEKTGYTLSSISVVDADGKEVATTGLTFTMPASAVKVTLSFDVNSYDVTVAENANCTVTVGSKKYAYDSAVSFAVEPKAGFNVTDVTAKTAKGDKVTVSGSVASGYTFTMPADAVTITVTTDAVDVAAPNVTLNGGAGQTADNISANQNYPVIAKAEAGDEFSTIKDGAVPTVSCNVENADYTFVKDELTGIYNFNAKTAGTYTITYKATAKSNNSDKENSATATLVITVTYTETQEAYNALSTYVNSDAITNAVANKSQYTVESYAAFETALTDAQKLLTGLPVASDENKAAYTEALTTLQDAFAKLELEVNYYIGGRFMGKSWAPTTKDYQLTKVEGATGLYKFETGKTVAELSAKVEKTDQYFFIHTGDGWAGDYYGSISGNGHNFENNTETNKLSLGKYKNKDDTANYIKFTDTTDNSSNVVIYFDLTDKDNPKLYYTAKCDPQMRIKGSVMGGTDGWNNDYDTALKFDYRDSDGSFVKTFNITADDVDNGNTYFRLFENVKYSDGTYKEYSNDANAAIDSYTSLANSLTTKENSSHALYFANVGTYKLHYTMGSSTPKVWVEHTAETRNVTFSITGESGNVKLNDEAVSNETVKSLVLGSSYTITVTPDADSYIKTFTVDGKAVEGNTYTANISANVAVVVEFAKKTLYSVTTGTFDGGSVAIDPTNAYEGQKVTVTPTANDGYVLENITAKTNKDQKTVELTKNSDGTYTFLMPADNVVVQANFRTKNTYTVKVSSDNQELGSVALNGSSNTLETTVKEGDTVTIKANPTGSNIFKSWSINGTYDIKDSKTTSDAEITLVVNSDITATASFTQAAPFKVAYGSKPDFIEMVATKNKDIYISTATVDSSTVSDPSGTPTAQFTIYDVENSKYAVFNDNNYIWLTPSNPSDTVDSWKDSYTHGKKQGLLNNGYGKKMYVIYNANTQTVTLTDSFDTGDKATLYVKTGTSGKLATGEYASNSEAPKLMATSSDTTYKKYSVEYDTSVNIQTTMSDKYLTARYYVAAYSVNGRSYPASAVDASKGIYQANITITEDLAENGVVEVTPIYYNRTIEEDDNYITFYVDADKATKDWGSTISVDAYSYKNGDKTKGELHAFGTYPGQPMVKDGQYYVIKVPRYYYETTSAGQLVIDKNSPISGVTLNNYYNDAVHNSLTPIARNMQTYDFSDFVALANKKDVKTIMFQSKFYNATGDANRNTSVVFNTAGEITNLNPKSQISNIGDAATIKVNPYEDFTDYYGRATDAIGNLLNDDQKADTDNLYIISTGSYNNQTLDYSTKGQWVTIWNVYDHNGKLITYGTPADFLNENTNQYKAIANNENYKGKPVKISYEKGLSYDKGVTSRTDGRWYYSALGQEFTSDVAIEYKYQKDKVYTADTNTNTANTGFIGEKSGATATINDVTTASFSSVTDTAHLSIKVANGWRFDGWYINGNKIGDNYTDISTDILMSNSYNIVARVSEIPTGTLELNHTAYTGTDPAAHAGTGFYYISAVVKKADNSTVKFDETQGVISIDNFAEDDKLTITLKAKCHGDNTVYALYEGEAGGYTEIGPEDKDLRGLSEFTYSFTVPAGSLFKNGKLGVNALNYYTDIVKVGGTCDITYKYYDRFGVEGAGNMVSYVVRNIELSTYEITNGYIPTNETITKYAPRIDTMYVDTKWNLADSSKVELGKSQATVIATQTDKTCDVYYPDKDGEYYTDLMNRKTVAYNTLFKDDNGNFILSAPETDESGKLFTYWEVYRADANGNPTELVTKCYERDFGLRIMADYYIVPVYDGKAPTLTANINAPVLNREIYGDSTSATDKLYVDLLTAFTSTAIPTFKENTTNLRVECGVFVLRNNTTKLSDEDRTTLVTAALAKDDDTTSTILANNYMRSADTETSVVSKLEELAQDSSVKDKSNTLATFDNDQYRITKLIFDNNSLTNKNRIDEVLKFTNNTANQNYIFTAYAFVVIKDSYGTVSEMQISDPQYFNLCYVGNKAL